MYHGLDWSLRLVCFKCVDNVLYKLFTHKKKTLEKLLKLAFGLLVELPSVTTEFDETSYFFRFQIAFDFEIQFRSRG